MNLKRVFGVLVPLALLGLVTAILLGRQPAPEPGSVVADPTTAAPPEPAQDEPAEPAADEAMIAGVPASKATGQFAAERPADLDPYRKWAPPIMRQQYLDKAHQQLLDKNTYAARAQQRGVYFHLGFMDKPATCGEVRFIDHEGEPIDDYQRFIYTGRSSVAMERDLSGSFEGLWEKLCVQTKWGAEDDSL